MSIGTILNIARTGLEASQVAIQTTSHNISNVDTPGYSEQQAVLQEAMPTPTSIGLMGDGVSVIQIKRYADENLQKAISSKNADVQQQQVYEQNLTQIQSIFNEDNSQLSTNMTTFFNDWSTLSTDPTSTADKETVAADGKTLCTTFSSMYNDLVNLQASLNGSVNDQIDDVNTVTSKIASLNKLIVESTQGTSEANDYLDERDQLLQQLSGDLNISYFTASTGMVNVLTQNGTSLVDGVTSYQLTKIPNKTTGMTDVGWQGPSGSTEDITSQISGGSLGAYLTNRDTTIPGYLGNLNGLAQSIMENVNYFHEQGNADVNANIPFFQSSTANYAQGISLATQIENGSGPVQTQNIMASSSTTEPTNNDVALAIASLGNQTILGGSTMTSTAAPSDSTPLGLSGHLAINGVAVTVGFGDTLSTVMASINAVTSQTGVTASISQSPAGFQLVLTASGSNQNISVANGDLDTSSQSLLQSLTTTDFSASPMNLSGTIYLGHDASGNAVSLNIAAGDNAAAVVTNLNTAFTNAGIGVTASWAGAGNPIVLTGPASIPSGTVTGTIGLAGSTYSDYEAGVVANIGQATKSATDLAEYNQNALTSLQQQQSQESGVSIDDEMSNLIKYQNAYQASARLYTVAQAMLDALLQSVGASTS